MGCLDFAQDHAAPESAATSLPEGLGEDTGHRKVLPEKALEKA